jgi:hypothetical protein
MCRRRRLAVLGKERGRGETHYPGVLERDHVVNVQVGRSGPGGAVVGRRPRARGGFARRVHRDGGGVPLQDVLACVARARDGDPRREQITVVVIAAGRGRNRQGRELGLGRGGAGDTRLYHRERHVC